MAGWLGVLSSPSESDRFNGSLPSPGKAPIAINQSIELRESSGQVVSSVRKVRFSPGAHVGLSVSGVGRSVSQSVSQAVRQPASQWGAGWLRERENEWAKPVKSSGGCWRGSLMDGWSQEFELEEYLEWLALP